MHLRCGLCWYSGRITPSLMVKEKNRNFGLHNVKDSNQALNFDIKTKTLRKQTVFCISSKQLSLMYDELLQNGPRRCDKAVLLQTTIGTRSKKTVELLASYRDRIAISPLANLNRLDCNDSRPY
uniref:Uncharacterized protein n=1 Tax=Glossina austeni TaxID=7395 RepID=A0A1A9URK9_GLOAU